MHRITKNKQNSFHSINTILSRFLEIPHRNKKSIPHNKKNFPVASINQEWWLKPYLARLKIRGKNGLGGGGSLQQHLFISPASSTASVSPISAPHSASLSSKETVLQTRRQFVSSIEHIHA